MREAGLATRRDAVRNLFGRYEGSRPDAPAFLLGSHLDSVPDGGRYDGPLGVLTALAVVERLAARGVRLPFALEVCAFSDEESVRYGTDVPRLLGRRGRLRRGLARPRRPRRHRDARRRCATSAATPTTIASCARDAASTVGWLELHIEQGPALESEGLPIGVVTGIQAQVRHAVGDPRHRRPRRHHADGRPPRRARGRRGARARDRGDRPRDARPGRDRRRAGRRAGRDERHPRPRRPDVRHPPPGRRAARRSR